MLVSDKEYMRLGRKKQMYYTASNHVTIHNIIKNISYTHDTYIRHILLIHSNSYYCNNLYHSDRKFPTSFTESEESSKKSLSLEFNHQVAAVSEPNTGRM